jgi:cytoskeletal protein CcmA (bactofilin family)
MLGMKKRKQPAIGTLIGAGARIHGDIEFTGGIHVDGYVRGNVEAVGDAASSISVSERGCVEGTVNVAHVLLNGTVNGDVLASNRVELGPRARVIGNVRYSLIEMAVGAEVNGKLIHESERPAGERVADESEPLSPVNALGE